MAGFSSQGATITKFNGPDPFAPPSRKFWTSFTNAVLATALFRCWHILIFFGGWATTVCLVSYKVYDLSIESTLLTVFGTVLGFVVSYRTTSSFERYNEGRRLWSQIVLGSRTFARAVWFHVPDIMPATPADKDLTEAQRKARVLVEKKTIINLLEAYAVAVKHYLRGEEGIYYTDLYHLVKFLPSYALPAGIPSAADIPDRHDEVRTSMAGSNQNDKRPGSAQSTVHPSSVSVVSNRHSTSRTHLPLPSTTPRKKASFQSNIEVVGEEEEEEEEEEDDIERGKMSYGPGDDGFLFPARMPPKYSLFDLFPFSLLVRMLTKKGMEVKGKKAARLRARLQHDEITHNIPLEISLYISSYIAALQGRKVLDPATTTLLFGTLNSLVDALTGLERILTTPIPFSYSIHLWLVTILYCLALPFQILSYLGWLTIPATVIASFIFFGFLVAGEEIENPFGYDKNDLNIDHFVHNIIRNELRALTALPTPDPGVWAFASENDLIFASSANEEHVSPTQWVQKGLSQMQSTLAIY